MRIISTLTVLLLLIFNTPATSQNWCCCQIGCIQDIFFIGCDAFCAGFGGGINHGSNFGYPDPTCGGLSCPPAVPIELSYFEGSILDQNKVLLKWKTESELNNKGFEIFRSNSITWERIAFKEGQGTTSRPIEYHFIDESPSVGTNYYLLKQIDFDGSEKYSEIIHVDIESNDDFIGELYPNPSRSRYVNLDYYSTKDEMIDVHVFSLTGRKIIDQTYSILEGGNHLNFDFTKLGTGMYVLQILNAEGRTRRKFIIR